MDPESVKSINEYELELEMIRQRSNNDVLIKAYKKLLQEKSDMLEINRSLQMESFEWRRKYLTLELKVKKLMVDLKEFIPNYMEIVKCIGSEDFLDPQESSSRTKTVQVIKPHAVNGTVLNASPTVILNRLDLSIISLPNQSNNLDVSLNISTTGSQIAEEQNGIVNGNASMNDISESNTGDNLASTIRSTTSDKRISFRELQVCLTHINDTFLKALTNESDANEESAAEAAAIANKENIKQTKSRKRKTAKNNAKSVPKKLKKNDSVGKTERKSEDEEPQASHNESQTKGRSLRRKKPASVKQPSLRAKLRNDSN